MKKTEIMETLFKGAITLVGELRGSKLESRVWLDKVTGQKRPSRVVHHNLEVKNGEEMIRVVEYYEEGQEIVPLGKRGEWFVVFPTAVDRTKGVATCRAERKDIHRIED